MKIKLKGFTLIELLVTIVIIGALAVIGVSQMKNYIAESNEAKFLAEWESACKKTVATCITESNDDCISYHNCISTDNELISNADFKDGLDNWSSISNVSVEGNVAIYNLSTEPGSSTLLQSNVFELGKKYLISIRYKSSGQYPRVYIGGGYVYPNWIVDGNWNIMQFDATANGTLFKFRKRGGTGDPLFYIDYISIKEI